MSKYHSVKTRCNHGHLHDSKKEKNRCDELHLLLKNGNISKLQVQKRIKLRPSFRFQGKAIRAISYIADFTYFDNDDKVFVIEDVKGFRTKIYQLKKKLLLFTMRHKHDFKFLES